jgi:hypothetical protein
VAASKLQTFEHLMSKIKTRILVSFFLFFFLQSLAQQNDSILRQTDNAFFIEIGGNAPFMSANYERKIFTNNFYSMHARIGFGFDIVTSKKNNLFVPSVPLEISSSFGPFIHHFEIGIGVTPFYSKIAMWKLPYNDDANYSTLDYKVYCLIVARVGYRIDTKKGWIYRIGYTPIIYNSSYKSEFDLQNNIGVSVGKFF